MLSKIGSVKCKFDRPPTGKLINLTVHHASSGKWFITICAEVEKRPQPKTGKSVGIDIGCSVFLTTSEGAKIENQRFSKRAQEKLAARQRRAARKRKGSRRHAKAQHLVAKVYEHVKNQRRDFHFKVALDLVKTYDVICIENLKHWNAEFKSIRKSMNDTAWFQFFEILAFKAEEAGKLVVKVDPKNTSQRCSGCHELVAKALDIRVHECPHCGLVCDRDYNAALNILQAGLACQGVLFSQTNS